MTVEGKKSSYYKLLVIGFIILLVIVGGVVIIYLSKTSKTRAESVRREKELKAGPVVKTVVATAGPGGRELVLIGDARPYQMATLYAQINGYLQKINVDKGDKVTEGEVLAYVDNPEIEQQYNSAVADLENKKKIAERDKQLIAKNFIAQETADISQTAVDMAEATVKSLAEQQQYRYLKAPFNGTITARYVDPGDLIQNAINAQTSAQPVVSIAELDRLRIYVYVEQRDAVMLKDGYPVDITLTERPGFDMPAKITRISGDLDPVTRMMLCEVDIDNKKEEIVPGSYVQVHIKYDDNASNELVVPSVALVLRHDTSLVAIVDKDSTLHYRVVKVTRNNGDKMNIAQGINAGDRVALSVGESLVEGQKVRITE